MKPLAISRPSKPKGETNPAKDKALEAVVKTRTYRLSVDLEEAIYDELRACAVKERRKNVELVRDAIRAYLDRKV